MNFRGGTEMITIASAMQQDEIKELLEGYPPFYYTFFCFVSQDFRKNPTCFFMVFSFPYSNGFRRDYQFFQIKYVRLDFQQYEKPKNIHSAILIMSSCSPY